MHDFDDTKRFFCGDPELYNKYQSAAKVFTTQLLHMRFVQLPVIFSGKLLFPDCSFKFLFVTVTT